MTAQSQQKSPIARMAHHEVTEFKSQTTDFAKGYLITAVTVYSCVFTVYLSVLEPRKGLQEIRAQAHHGVIPRCKKSQMLHNISHELLYGSRFASAIMASSLVCVCTVRGRPDLKCAYLTETLLQRLDGIEQNNAVRISLHVAAGQHDNVT